MNVLIVDGYNIIGDWEELKCLKEESLSHARDRLVEILAEYQAYYGIKVIVVFDAHFVKGPKSTATAFRIEIIYTKENETADERIERLVTKHKNVENAVYVATSDHLEQRIIFGRGALRKSARELSIEVEEMTKNIKDKIQTKNKETRDLKISLNDELKHAFEKWRRRK